MKWVNASELMPQKGRKYIAKYHDELGYIEVKMAKDGWNFRFENDRIINWASIYWNNISVYEWLDESPDPEIELLKKQLEEKDGEIERLKATNEILRRKSDYKSKRLKP